MNVVCDDFATNLGTALKDYSPKSWNAVIKTINSISNISDGENCLNFYLILYPLSKVPSSKYYDISKDDKVYQYQQIFQILIEKIISLSEINSLFLQRLENIFSKYFIEIYSGEPKGTIELLLHDRYFSLNEKYQKKINKSLKGKIKKSKKNISQVKMSDFGNKLEKAIDYNNSKDNNKLNNETSNPWDSVIYAIIEIKKIKYGEACLNEYLIIYSLTVNFPHYYDKSKDGSNRFQQVFSELIEKCIKLSKPDSNFIQRLEKVFFQDFKESFEEGQEKAFDSLLHHRYHSLTSHFQRKARSPLEEKTKKPKIETSILDYLKQSYSTKNKKAGGFNELYAFSIYDSDVLRNAFELKRVTCANSWKRCIEEYNENNTNKFNTDFESYKKWVDGYGVIGKIDQLFQVLKLSRERVVEIDVDGNLVLVNSNYLDIEFYLHVVINIQSVAVRNFPINQQLGGGLGGFTEVEQDFFINVPLMNKPYFINYKVFIDYAFKHYNKAIDVIGLYRNLIIFAEKNRITLLNFKKTEDIYETIRSESVTDLAKFKKKSLYLAGYPSLNGNIKIGTKIGENQKFTIIYTDNTSYAIIEFEQFPQILFRADVDYLVKALEGGFYERVAKNTQGMLPMALLMFQILGYAFSILTGGFSKLVVDVTADVIGDFAVDTITSKLELPEWSKSLVGLGMGILSPSNLTPSTSPRLVDGVDDLANINPRSNIFDSSKIERIGDKCIANTSCARPDWLEDTRYISSGEAVDKKVRGLEPTILKSSGKRPQTRIRTREEQIAGTDDKEWDYIRTLTPSPMLKKKAKQQLPEGSPDPALEGELVIGSATADHIVPADKIRQFPNFVRLSREAKIRVLNMEENFVATSTSANSSRKNRYFSEWKQAPEGKRINESFRNKMIEREKELIPKIQEKINFELQQDVKRNKLPANGIPIDQ